MNVVILMFYCLLIIYMVCLVFNEVTRYRKSWNSLTANEADELNDIMTYFHEDPNYEDFLKVYNSRKELQNSTATKTHKFWLYGVYLSQPEFFAESLHGGKAYVGEHMREIERGLKRIEKHPTTELINCVWALYFATGNTQYSDLVKNIAENSNVMDVAQHAGTTYYRVFGVRLTHVDEVETTEPVGEPTAPIAFIQA